MATGFDDGAYRGDLGVATAAGGVASLANPHGRTLIVTALVVDITTASTGAGTIDAGIAATAATLNDGLIDGASTAAIATLSNGANPGTNGKLQAVWKADQFLTISQASGAVAGMVGTFAVQFIPA